MIFKKIKTYKINILGQGCHCPFKLENCNCPSKSEGFSLSFQREDIGGLGKQHKFPPKNHIF